ncbi:hypothetical protein HR45_00505 [Shewanella mangrovi]|uniref:Outer membrane protein beta-barrel domain-containing protein n=1 Tax=Shewanella mangrovi TaxID=1515746 RepID=A0A094JG73_9GAMM|nr:hypothetical protein [Shewanella mangrovi]KFZ38920.1 hypothetical protein HR45_00505 [Shewanella mangrovi]
MKKQFLIAALLMSCTVPALAGETHFSISGGLPYLVIPEVSYHPNQEQRWFLNYKAGLDDGVSAGFEQAVSANRRHALGVVLGALGVKNGHRHACEDNSPVRPDDANGNESGDEFDNAGCEIAYALIVAAFDNHTVNGLGVSYSYSGNGLSEAGLRVKFELGYGRIEDADFDKNGYTGGFSIGYQF